ncbi:MAG: hypothetical protein LAT82_00025 [Nanoarchaeota archaeon]|nr:hypothetical protein [Nanoarchaeota archaeon]
MVFIAEINYILLGLFTVFINFILYMSYISANSKELNVFLKKRYYKWIQIFMIMSFLYSTLILIQASIVFDIMRYILFGHQLFIAYILYLFYIKKPLDLFTDDYKLIIYHFHMLLVMYYCSLLLFNPYINMYIVIVLAYTYVRFRYTKNVFKCDFMNLDKNAN